MANCEQTNGQSVLQHGDSVKSYTFDLINHLRNGSPLQHEWKLPEWLHSHKDLILQSLPSDETLELYTKFHDIGKPYCLEIDNAGKRHFPNHAEVSFQTFTKLFDDPLAAELIRHDMDIHLLKADGVESFCESANALTHLIVGLAEVHSNSQMFGGMESTSFKIKWKCLNQRGKQIINFINQKKTNNKMKTQAQNTKEVMTYLEKSAQNFFESEGGKNWQSIVKLHALDKYVFIKDGDVHEFNMNNYIGEGITEGKTRLKQKIHPQWNPSTGPWSKGYGHGPAKKLRAVRWNKARLELTATAAQAYLAAQTEKESR